MPGTRSKRATKPTYTSGLLYTTYEFIQRLRARGRELRLDVRDVLLQWLHAHSDGDVVWDPESPELQRQLASVPPLDDAVPVPFVRLCALLAPLQCYDLQYVNLAVVFYSLTPMEMKNIYRYCYLEWVQHSARTEGAPVAHSSSADPCLWTHTPRQFAGLHGPALGRAWDQFLATAIKPDDANDAAPVALFFINRLYSYLTPCG